jgi:uncharacterized protein
MSVELRPLGVKCNIRCQYCYQNPERDAGNANQRYDMARMKAAVEQEGGPFTLFGGEPLMLPMAELEELWAWGHSKYGSNSLQTNGALITQEHVRMFKQYRVHVGISVDGPDELNDIRWAGSLERTREATARTHAAIERLCDEGIPPSLIATLHRGNATADKLPRMHEWLRHLRRRGITSMRLHVLEVESPAIRAKYALSTAENVVALSSFHAIEKELAPLKLDVFGDMRNMLLGRDNSTTCVWNACDPYTTRAVRGIEGSGQRSNCGRTNKDGIDFVKAASEGFERYLALYHTPQEHGGCAGCRFFLMCKGQCPGTSIDGDWRNRTEHCDLWKTLYRQLEEEMLDQGIEPLSSRGQRKQVEDRWIEACAAGQLRNMVSILAELEAKPASPQASGNTPHGDHTDANWRKS